MSNAMPPSGIVEQVSRVISSLMLNEASSASNNFSLGAASDVRKSCVVLLNTTEPFTFTVLYSLAERAFIFIYDLGCSVSFTSFDVA